MIKKEWGKSPAKIPRWGVFKSKIPHIFLSTIYQLFIQMKFWTNEHNQTQPDKKNWAYQGFRGLCRYEQTQPDSTRQTSLSSHNPEVAGSSPVSATMVCDQNRYARWNPRTATVLGFFRPPIWGCEKKIPKASGEYSEWHELTPPLFRADFSR